MHQQHGDNGHGLRDFEFDVVAKPNQHSQLDAQKTPQGATASARQRDLRHRAGVQHRTPSQSRHAPAAGDSQHRWSGRL